MNNPDALCTGAQPAVLALKSNYASRQQQVCRSRSAQAHHVPPALRDTMVVQKPCKLRSIGSIEKNSPLASARSAPPQRGLHWCGMHCFIPLEIGNDYMHMLLLPAIARCAGSIHRQLQRAYDVGALGVVAEKVQNPPSFLQTRT